MTSLYTDFAAGGANVVQSDTVDLAVSPAGIQVTAPSGTVKVLCEDGTEVQVNVPAAGYILPYRVRRVLNTGTSIADADLLAFRLS